MWVQDEPLLQVTYSSFCHMTGVFGPMDKKGLFSAGSVSRAREQIMKPRLRVQLLTSCPSREGHSGQAVRLSLQIMKNTHKTEISYVSVIVS